jgi:chromosome segregation ATPase
MAKGNELLSTQKRAREKAENERNRLLDVLAECEQNGAAERSCVSEILTEREALQVESDVLHERKQKFEEEITQGRRRLAGCETELLRLAMKLFRDEAPTKAAGGSVDVEIGRMAMGERHIEKATQEEASERHRAQIGENEFQAMKCKAGRMRDRMREVCREIDRARTTGILNITDATNYESEAQSNLEEISELDCRLGQTVAETRHIDGELAQLRTIYRKAIAEFQHISHETADGDGDDETVTLFRILNRDGRLFMRHLTMYLALIESLILCFSY